MYELKVSQLLKDSVLFVFSMLIAIFLLKDVIYSNFLHILLLIIGVSIGYLAFFKNSRYIVHFIIFFWIYLSGYPILDFGYQLRSDDLLFLTLICYYLIYKNNLNQIIPKHWSINLVIIYLLFYLVSIFFSIYIFNGNTLDVGILNFLRLVELFFFFLVIFKEFDVRNNGLFSVINFLLFCGIGIVFLDGMQLYYYKFFDLHLEGSNFYGRFATFPSSAEFGPFVLIMFFISLSLFFAFERNKSAKLIYFLTSICFVVVIIGSESRSSLISLFLVYSLAGILKYRILIIPGLFLIPFISYIPKIVDSQKIHRLISVILESDYNSLINFVLSDHSLLVRVKNWPQIFDYWLSSPIFGLGPGFFGEIYNEIDFPLLAIDNAYFRSLVETGIIGFCIFICLFWGNLFCLYKIQSSIIVNRFESKVIFGCFLGILAVMINGLLIDVFESVKTVVYIWVLSAVLFKFYAVRKVDCGKD